MKINKTDLWRYAIELVIVMVGVFLGILVSDWNEGRNHERLKQTLLSNMVAELETNKLRLDNAYEYHSKSFSILDSLWKSWDQSTLIKPFFEGRGFMQIPNWKGIGIPLLKKSSYESAVISNIFPDMNPKLLEQISNIYDDITIYTSGREKIVDRMYNINSNTKLMDVFLIIEIIRGDILSSEKYLSNKCEKTIKLIKEQH